MNHDLDLLIFDEESHSIVTDTYVESVYGIDKTYKHHLDTLESLKIILGLNDDAVEVMFMCTHMGITSADLCGSFIMKYGECVYHSHLKDGWYSKEWVLSFINREINHTMNTSSFVEWSKL